LIDTDRVASSCLFTDEAGTPQGDDKAVMEKQILGFKPAPRPKQVDGGHPERAQGRKHQCK
jgi:hypothetical protein